MAGVGTAGRSGRLRNGSAGASGDWRGRLGDDGMWWNIGPGAGEKGKGKEKGQTQHPGGYDDSERKHGASVPLDVDEFRGMVGVGSAARSGRARVRGDGGSGSGGEWGWRGSAGSDGTVVGVGEVYVHGGSEGIFES